MIAEPEDTGRLEALVGKYIERQREGHVSSTDEPHAYASEAGACRRKVAFRVAGFEPSDPIDIHGQMATLMGNQLHDTVQSALGDSVDIEVKWSLMDERWRVTGRADIVGSSVVGEIKSMHSYPFELAASGIRGAEPQGPKMEHLLQAAMGAEALEKDKVRLIYVNKARTAKTETFAQWTVDYDYELQKAVHEELDSLSEVVRRVEIDELEAPLYNGEVITSPTATRWPCGYCGWRSMCAELPPEIVDIASVNGTRS